MASLPVYSSAAMIPMAANIAKRPLLVPSTIGRCTPELGARTLGCGQGPDYTHTVMHERTRNETFTDVGRQPTKLKTTKDHPKNR